MRHSIRTLAPIAALFGALSAGPAACAPQRLVPGIPPSLSAALDAVSAARLEADMRVLADDAMEGRGTGTPGYDRAAAWVVARMESLGLAPAGTTGFLQPVPLRRADVDRGTSQLGVIRGGTLRVLVPEQDYQMSADFLRERVTTEAPIAHVGFGVSAPEMGHDDYAGLDVRGKVVVMFRGAPPRFPHDERAYYSSARVKEETAAAHGAVGLLEIRLPAEQQRLPWSKGLRLGRLPAFRWTDDAGAPAGVQALLQVGARLSPGGAAVLFDGAPFSLEQAAADAESSVVRSFDLAGTLKCVRVTRHAPASSPNVVGLLRGSDPRLARECIVVSAHLDHLGIGEPVAGDSIHNGAYDNASGVAMMLELARTLKRLPTPPRRSILFLAVTGEEKGMVGSDYFARHAPPESLTLVGNVNLDMVMMIRPVRAVIAFGAEHSSLGPVVEWAARLQGLQVVPDPMPREVIFIRSDQFSFVQQGVPGIFPVSAGDGTLESMATSRDWNRDHYHAPSDDMSQPFDWPSGERFTRMATLAVWRAANDAARPRWNDGDFFGRRFGPRR